MAAGLTTRAAGRTVLGSLLVALGCARSPALPAPPCEVRTLAVPAPSDRTGSVVAGDLFLERLALGGGRVTLSEVLAAELRTVIARRGFTLADDASDAATLELVIERWEPEAPNPSYVVVDVEAGLRARPGGRALWSVRRARWMVATRGAPTPAAASTMAARAVAEALVGSWTPACTAAPGDRPSPPP